MPLSANLDEVREPRAKGEAVSKSVRTAAVPQIGEGADRTQQTIDLSSIPILKTKLWESKNFTIDPTVQVDGYYYIFTVQTKAGTHQVVSVRKLIKFCHELDVLEEYKSTQKGNPFAKGMGQAASGIGKGFVQIFRHPGQSTKRVGAGFGRLFRGAGRAFKRKKAKPTLASDGTDLALLGKGPAGPERRLLANELGLDVYTTNGEIQLFLNQVARKRLAGKLPLNSAIFALPGGSVFTLSLTPMGHDQSTELLIRNQSPTELKTTLAQRFGEISGIDHLAEDSPILALVDNPNYTPRQLAYLWRYFADLKGMAGMREALIFLGAVDSPAKAEVASAQAELLALLHQRGKPMKRFAPLRNTLGGLAEDGTLCFLISRDTIRFWSDVETSLNLATQAGRSLTAARVEFWSTGDVDHESAVLAAKKGIAVYQNILEHKVFQQAREGDEAR
jgi:hypothetical protein